MGDGAVVQKLLDKVPHNLLTLGHAHCLITCSHNLFDPLSHNLFHPRLGARNLLATPDARRRTCALGPGLPTLTLNPKPETLNPEPESSNPNSYENVRPGTRPLPSTLDADLNPQP